MLKQFQIPGAILATLAAAGSAAIPAFAQSAPQAAGNSPLIVQFKDDGGAGSHLLPPAEAMQSGTSIILDDRNPSSQMKLKTDFIMIDASSKLVKDKPYAAEAVTDTTQTLADGNRIVRHFQNKYFRDSAGRTRREQTFGALKAAGEAPNEVKVFIYDPVAKVNYVLDPGDKSARKMTYSSLPMQVRVMNLDKSDRAASLPPLPPPVPDTPGVFEFSSDARDSVDEDLGTRTIEGLSCTGKRTTTTIPAGSLGNERPIVITVENWYSKDIDADVLTITNDPRMGETRYALQNVERGEQPISLFEPPADYKVEADKR
jgi:hypothetical protein